MFCWPFVSRGRYDDVKAERDRLDAERKILFDRLAALGLGGPLFEKPAPAAEEPASVENGVSTPTRTSVPMTRRPSQITAEMTRRAFRGYHARRSVGQEEREIVMRQFDQVEADVHNEQAG